MDFSESGGHFAKNTCKSIRKIPTYNSFVNGLVITVSNLPQPTTSWSHNDVTSAGSFCCLFIHNNSVKKGNTIKY